MLDFVRVSTRWKNGVCEVYPSFMVCRSKDLMVRGNAFYAIWDSEENRWSTDEFDAIRLIDNCVKEYANENGVEGCIPQLLIDSDNCMIDKWLKYVQKQQINQYETLDETLIWLNTPQKRENYSSKCLPYPLIPGPHSNWDRIVGTLYDPDERHKIEWAIGAIVSGDSRWIQKFMVFYGAAGTGKSTILNIIQELFTGYYAVFDAKALGSNNNGFALDSFRNNPLVAIQHDGDLSRIEDNTKINSLVSHEEMTVNEKYKSSYVSRFKAFLLMGTNKPVKITDAKSGLIRRLIDVSPSGDRLEYTEYKRCLEQTQFEYSGIASHCLEVYQDDPEYYDSYIPTEMMGASNDFWNFISENFFMFQKEKDIALNQAWDVYKNYCEDAKVPYPLPKRAFKEELKNYFDEFHDRYSSDTIKRTRNYYVGFQTEKFLEEENPKRKTVIVKEVDHGLKAQPSIFDKIAQEYPAQTTTKDGLPICKWDNNKTLLKNIDTSKLHYVKVPLNHIVIDFDISVDGEKNLEKNLEAASKWPKTYMETSKSGKGIHLHYIYEGDPNKLSRVYEEHIEIKVFNGNSSLRRQLTLCNNEPINTISSGLPLREESKKMISSDIIKNEKMLRTMIVRNLRKEIHSATKPSIDFINKLLNDMYDSGKPYDVSDMRHSITAFAMSSTNQAQACLKIVTNMKYKSEESSEGESDNDDNALVFFDMEIYPNLTLVCWKFEGEGKQIHPLINPKPSEIHELAKFNLIGFNNRGYDNHMLYGIMMGYSPAELYELSQRIISGQNGGTFMEAYNISYTDVYDFASAPNKQSLKKYEIELGLKHNEMDLPWDQPVDEKDIPKIIEYCCDDVNATEAVFHHLKGDWSARQILAKVAGKSVNHSTNSISTTLVFGQDRKPQCQFHYRDLAKPVKAGDLNPEIEEYISQYMPMEFESWNGEKSILPFFPGYKYDFGKSTYRDMEVGEGGLVVGRQGIYDNAALLDITSMHPNSANNECVFGPKYTKRYYSMVEGRVAVKHRDAQGLEHVLDGALVGYAKNDQDFADLANALKTPINAAYGLTCAKFDNPFRDPRNVDNIVAKRGALFMTDLLHAVEEQGYTVAHIKTDSIKIPNADPYIINFVNEFGAKYGYGFEHEATYEKLCLINNAVYIAKTLHPDKCMELYGYVPGDNKKKVEKWTATGSRFAVPYVFKTLFSKEDLVFEDFRETKAVKSAMYLEHENGHKQFIGKVGSFIPVKEGGTLLREAKDGEGNLKYDSVTGTKGYKWLPEENLAHEENWRDLIDYSYFDSLVNEALDCIEEYGDVGAFLD